MAVYSDRNSRSQKPRVNQIRKPTSSFVKPTKVIGKVKAEPKKQGRPIGFSPKKK